MKLLPPRAFVAAVRAPLQIAVLAYIGAGGLAGVAVVGGVMLTPAHDVVQEAIAPAAALVQDVVPAGLKRPPVVDVVPPHPPPARPAAAPTRMVVQIPPVVEIEVTPEEPVGLEASTSTAEARAIQLPAAPPLAVPTEASSVTPSQPPAPEPTAAPDVAARLQATSTPLPAPVEVRRPAAQVQQVATVAQPRRAPARVRTRVPATEEPTPAAEATTTAELTRARPTHAEQVVVVTEAPTQAPLSTPTVAPTPVPTPVDTPQVPTPVRVVTSVPTPIRVVEKDADRAEKADKPEKAAEAQKPEKAAEAHKPDDSDKARPAATQAPARADDNPVSVPPTTAKQKLDPTRAPAPTVARPDTKSDKDKSDKDKRGSEPSSSNHGGDRGSDSSDHKRD